MGFLNNLGNGVIDIVKLAIIAIVCLVVIFIGGYLMADFIGLIPEATGLYRPLSVQTFLTDLPFIGTNMIYLIIAMVLLIVVWIAIELYSRKSTAASEQNEPKNGMSGSATGTPVAAEPEAPEIKQ